METQYRGRRALALENSSLRVTVLHEGGHIAEIYDKATGVNPLWTPPWPTMEPSAYDRLRPPVYGDGSDARLLAGIMGHNVCLDIFGGPSDAEASAGLSAHGEGPVVPYELTATGDTLVARARLPIARLEFERRIVLRDRALVIHETVANLSDGDRAIGWTQHVTLGPPFLERGVTEFRASAGRSIVFESAFGAADYLKPGAEFSWPMAPRVRGGTADLRVFNDMAVSSGYTAHLMEEHPAHAYFVAFAPVLELAFGYVWKQADFPWMGIWEENQSRVHTPWDQRVIARGMEFGVSPFPESREAMVDRGRLFGVPTFRTIPAHGVVEVEYCVVLRNRQAVPEALEWPT